MDLRNKVGESEVSSGGARWKRTRGQADEQKERINDRTMEPSVKVWINAQSRAGNGEQTKSCTKHIPKRLLDIAASIDRASAQT
jgi:hypothetical protein